MLYDVEHSVQIFSAQCGMMGRNYMFCFGAQSLVESFVSVIFLTQVTPPRFLEHLQSHRNQELLIVSVCDRVTSCSP